MSVKRFGFGVFGNEMKERKVVHVAWMQKGLWENEKCELSVAIITLDDFPSIWYDEEAGSALTCIYEHI